MSSKDNVSNNIGNTVGDGEPGGQLKLTDPIDDCFEHIFSYLDYDDLLNIADTNKQLKQSAGLEFARQA